MRLQFLLARKVPDRPGSIVVEASAILRRRGFEVSTVIAEESALPPDRLGRGTDVWLLKSHTLLSLSLAGILHARGRQVINRYPSCLAARNKITAARLLQAAGISTPSFWVTSDLSQLTPFVRQHPLVIKPHLGWRGLGVRIARDEQELLAVPRLREPVLVQELIPGSDDDLRVYVAGDRVFATRKEISGVAALTRQVPVTDEVRRIALRCGEAFGLGLYGLDLLQTPDGPRVVDVNYFPGYNGVPGAAEAVAGYIAQCATHVGSHALAGAVF
jgi:ribosomal protein S6--L-glutamate ligase